MCHICGQGLMATKDGSKKQEDEKLLNINTGVPIGPRKSCEEKQELQNVRLEVPSTYVTPMISPTLSLSSIDRSFSSCSEFSVDGNSFERSQEQDLFDGGREDDLNHKNPENIQKYNGQEAKFNGIKISYSSEENDCTDLGDVDLQIWDPPDPEDPQDDTDGSISYNNDDNEVIYGMKWGESASFSVSRNEQFKSYCFKEFKQRMMEEVMNGKFKAIVSQLLESVYVSTSDEHGTSWVDIVTSLSWEAAALIKHAAIAGNVIDPDGLVKVKCVATGFCNQSQIIKGLVFKKHAAHKHMPNKLKNPRLLLIKGMLGSSGLSSFKSMEQEKEYLKSIFELIEMCHPNVILVEKTVSRDIQELVLQKGMTLVLDMKLHRLERVARCTGSQILSCDNLKSQNLAQCDSVYFEKFVEEHSSFGGGGKRPTKTFMFIEGCPTCLGCTILLKGTNSDELKRIKCVLRCAVLMAYHLILETSFLLDQNAMFSTTAFAKVVDLLPDNQCTDLINTDEVPPIEDLNTETGLSVVDIPISDGIHDGSLGSVEIEIAPDCRHSHESYNPATFSEFSSMSSSLEKVIKDSFPISSSPSYKSLSAYFGFNGREQTEESTKAVSVSGDSVEDENDTLEVKNCGDEENPVDGRLSRPLSISSEEHLEMRQENISKIDYAENRDDCNAVLDSQSILVLMSSRNSSKGTMCTQSHFSHIMFYKKFDIPLRTFLVDNLFTQVRYCTACGELPEAHFYYYAHRNKQLTIQVKRLPPDKCLPGEAEGKIWMWCRCGKCKSSSGLPNSTKRVLISSATCNLSFGKFLELSLSNYFSYDRKSSCGHSPDRDFLYFFGLGYMVAMFQYSTVATFTIALPSEKLEFGTTAKQESLHAETDNVYAKAIILFTEVECCLKKIKDLFSSSTSNNDESIKKLHDAEGLLKEERTFFEINIKNVVASNQNMGSVAYTLLSINGLMWELLIESCIWERRLQSILSDGTSKATSHVAESIGQEHFSTKDKGASIGNTEYLDTLAKSNNVDSSNVNDKSDTTADNVELIKNEVLIKDPEDEFKEQHDAFDSPLILRKHEIPTLEKLIPQRFCDVEFSSEPDTSTCTLSRYGSAQSDVSVLCDSMQESGSTPVIAGTGIRSPNAEEKQPDRSGSLHLPEPGLHSSNEWFWKSFPFIRQIGIKDFKKNFLPTFECISSHTQQHLPITNQLINEEASRLHIPLRNENFVVSDYEGELSSIIACALAFRDPVKSEAHHEDNRGESRVVDSSSGLDISHGLSCSSNITSNISLPDSSGSDTIRSTGSVSAEELHVSRAPENHSVGVSLGYSQSIWKEKYLVICHYATQFCELRNHCCPSELDYIASLSRCKNWDAKGGKSKSVFAKTLDDRLIIKEIKKTEFDSFRGFAPLYFKYMKDSFGTGSQTCLAKILGIYQVIKRPTKSAKEAKHDLIVMENLTYNRKISRQYDLKGALYARYNTTDAAGDVLLDQNFVNDMNSSPLYVSQKAKRYLQRAVWNDTTFLNSINVMDYSLLVGVDSERRELVCGIIDYIRQYTWDKHLETWMKTSLAPKNFLPTVISPKEYKKRFRKFMATHFLSVPDNWCSMESTEPCKHCSREDNDSTHQNPQDKGKT